MKKLIRSILIGLKIPVTQNIRYDILTKELMKKVLKSGSNCVDIGGFKGEIMDEILKFSPAGGGIHYIFEPVPGNFKIIKEKFSNQPGVNVLNIALSDKPGTAVFNYVPDYPAYSGFKVRDYPKENVPTQQIEVKTDTLDNSVAENLKVDFIKIDVEGAEYLVLQGSKKILQHSKPIVIFEYGLGASNYYGTEPAVMFDFFDKELNYNIYLIEKFLKGKPSLKKEEFISQYSERKNYYFVAAPKAAI